MKVKINLLRTNSKKPRKAHSNDAGYDLFVSEIKKKSLFKIHYKLGISVDFPEGMYAEVPPRSSIHKTFMWMANSLGVIDNGYKGEWQAVFYKIPFISKPYKVGEACCQAIFKFMQTEGIEFTNTEILKQTDRGNGGFGSSGNK